MEIDAATPGGGSGSTKIDVDVERTGRFERKLTVGAHTFSVLSVPQGSDFLVEVDGAVHRISGGEAGLVRAPAPAMVVSIPVKAGDIVEPGDVVAVVESMKLETALRAPVAGRVREVLVAPNTQVEGGTKLVRLEPDAEGVEADAAARADLAPLANSAASRGNPATVAADALTSLRFLVLGFDIDEARRPPAARGADLGTRRSCSPDDPGVLAGETAVLRIFADLCALSRNRRGPEDETQQVDPAGEEARNPQEFLYAYLRSRDADAEGLPESFRAKLRQALAHYGVPDLDPSDARGLDALSSSLYRMFLAHRRAAAHVPVILELLQWRLSHPDSLPAASREEYQRTLDTLVTATQLRHPVVGGLARRVRYTCFDAPLIATERAAGQDQVRAELDRLSDDPAARAAQIDSIVSAAEPILGVFGERHHAAMLEVMTRRYYRVRPLKDVQVSDRGGRPLLTATYHHDGEDHVVLATTVHTAPDAPPAGDPMAVQGDLRRLVAQLPEGRSALLDLYVIAGEAPDADPERSAEKIRAMLGRLPERLARVAVAVRRPGGDERSAWFTFVPGPDRRPVENRTLRGLHPMVAERLGLWRLSGFELTPAAVPHRRAPVPRCRPGRPRRPAPHRALRRPRPHGAARRRGHHPGPPPARARARRLPRRAALRPSRRPRRREAGLEPRPALRVARGGRPPRRARRRRPGARTAVRGPGPGAGDGAVPPRGRPDGGTRSEFMLRMSRPPGAGLTVRVTDPPVQPLRELDAYTQKVMRARRRGAVYPYELVPMLVRNPDRGGAAGTFTEYDLDADGAPGGRRPCAGRQQRQHRAGHRHHRHHALPGGHDARRADRRPDQGPRARWPSRSARG